MGLEYFALALSTISLVLAIVAAFASRGGGRNETTTK